jgi:hypothetical protein
MGELQVIRKAARKKYAGGFYYARFVGRLEQVGMRSVERRRSKKPIEY